ncbi:MAG TPA: SurA N-terminal domain-containing protein [Terriglobales bacterium]|nr:SurA N-terminal domain-containing protein [Terriglobales bacterium]
MRSSHHARRCWLKTRLSFRAQAGLTMALVAAVVLFEMAGCTSGSHGSDVVASVNGKKLLRSDLDRYYKQQLAGAANQPEGAQAESLQLSIVKSMVGEEIILQRAEKLGLLASDEEVESKINEFKAPSTEEQFQRKLKDKNLTLDELKREIRRSLTIDKVYNKEINSKINVTDADISNYYNQHKAEFNLIEPVYHLARITVSSAPNPQLHNLQNNKAQNDTQAKAKIQQILSRLQNGDDFASLASNYSEDSEASSNGGDLGFVPESALKNNTDPATREAVSKLAPGQISPIIPLVDPATHRVAGYQIVKLIAKEPAGQRDLNDPRVQQSIREQIRQTREQLLRAAYQEVIVNQAKVENYLADEILKKNGGK